MASHHAAYELFDQQFDAFKSGVKKLIDKVDPRPEPSRLKAFVEKTGEAIKTHPIAAVGFALGIGYAIVRIARR